LEEFHIDGLRIDAVASMLYLDYSRREGEWIPNHEGGKENFDAIELLRAVSRKVSSNGRGAITLAEESTAWPGVTRAVEEGGLGFTFKWNMGWMHDTLKYLGHDPVHRSFHHGQLTFRGIYQFHENFVLALSHDEVVHGKGSLLDKMPGDAWQKRANLRLLLAYQWTMPGKKLVFMGVEMGQWREWNHDASLDWDLLADGDHARLALTLGELNRLYRDHPALHRHDCDPAGFAWIVAGDAANSIVAYERIDPESDQQLVVVLNFTPVPRHNYRVGVPRGGAWRELLNTDAADLGGSNQGNGGLVEAYPVGAHGRPFSLNLTVPPLGALILARA
ncbi:MAG: 1,4-alpha-glucan branching enzyme, partial [Deltaproteobacteria bacterium]|nr:1,4-alpha-glucan branching enzyme [Kofleriaceae bacterium]